MLGLQYPKKSLVAIMGPTASGKSALGLALAQKYNGEIISADSAQVYREADIGTAKPSAAEMATVVHHLVDIRSLNEDFSLANFQRLAEEKARDIWQRGLLPLVVGGTGLYVRGFIEGYTLVGVPSDLELRERLSQRSLASLLEELEAKDPVTAGRIDRCNKRRVVRALEVTLQTGRPFSECSRRNPPDMRSLKLGIRIPREIMMQRIDERLERMVEAGWLEEVRKLSAKGYGDSLRRLRILGYPQLLDVVENGCPLAQALEEVRLCTRRLAKRQCTWIRAEPNVQWIDYGDEMLAQAENAIERFLQPE